MRDYSTIIFLSLLLMGAFAQWIKFPHLTEGDSWVAASMLVGFVIGKWFSGEKP